MKQVVHCSTAMPTKLLEESKHFFPTPQSTGSGTLASLFQEATCFRHDPASESKKKSNKSHLVAISSRNAGSPHQKKAVITIQLETTHPASLWHFAELYLCFIPIYWEHCTLTSCAVLLSVIICIRNQFPRVFTAQQTSSACGKQNLCL